MIISGTRQYVSADNSKWGYGMNQMLRVFIAFSLLLTNAFDALAASNETLQFFEDEAKVITASRREQPILDAPMAIEVITAEEIEASGATNLWDLLRYRPGMDVVDGHTPHSMRAIVSIRGFVEGFARNVLVLVDGRNVVSANAGGVFWAQLPVQLQDVERIEIVRGPNAALYGTGAALGMINIITKKPTGRTEAIAQGLGGNRSLRESSESFDSSAHSFDYHISHTYHSDSGFLSANASAANPSETNLDNGGVANDLFQSNKVNFRSNWKPKDGTNLEFFAGGSQNNEGISIETVPSARDHFNEHFEMAKFSTKLKENSTLDISSSYKEYKDSFSPTPIGTVDHIRNRQYDEEIVQHLNWGQERYNTTYGLNYQNSSLYSDHEFFTRSPVGYQIYRGFFSESARLNDYLSLTGAAAWEATDFSPPHPNYQFASVMKPSHDQSFRLSYSVAHTIPTLRLLFLNELRDLGQQRVGNRNLLPEKLISYETGYRSIWLDHHLETNADLYYTTVKNIDDDVSTSVLPPVEKVTGSSGVTFKNSNQAIERGAEIELKYRFSQRRSVYVNYSYEHVTDWSQNVGEVTKSVPPHKLNLGGMTDLPKGFSASFNLGYKDSYIIDNQADELAAHAYWRLDARIAYAVPQNKSIKIFLAGQNLLKPRHQEFADGLAVARTYYGGVTVQFGGHR